MEVNPKIGFASIKGYAKDGKLVGEPTFHHRVPVGVNEDNLNIERLEKELKAALIRVIEENLPTDKETKFGFFIEYTKDQYRK
jgi:glycine/serine hydroxymethyltransferase